MGLDADGQPGLGLAAALERPSSLEVFRELDALAILGGEEFDSVVERMSDRTGHDERRQ
nr:hypothetical protein [uncultured Noviherbaspirillum sp.]